MGRLLLTALVLLIGLSQQGGRTDVIEESFTIEDMLDHFASTSQDEEHIRRVLRNASQSENAVVFVHMNWSPNSHYMRRVFAEFFVDFHRRQPEHPVGFHFVDCSEIGRHYRQLRELPGWTNLEASRGTNLIHGDGEIVWLSRGRVLEVKGGLWSATDLRRRTKDVFGRAEAQHSQNDTDDTVVSSNQRWMASSSLASASPNEARR